MNTNKIAITIILLGGITALVGIATVPSLANKAYAHQCLLPNTGNTAFPGQTPLTGNCPAGSSPLNQNQETARGLIGQQQNNNPTNFYCVEVLGSGPCPFP